MQSLLKLIIVFITIIIFNNGCTSTPNENPDVQTSNLQQSTQLNKATTKSTAFKNDFFSKMLSTRFDYPVGDINGNGKYKSNSDSRVYNGWYIATETGESYSMGLHTGEDWNGLGGGNTDKGQPVYAISNGLVIHAKKEAAPWGNVVIIEHHYIENAAFITIYSVYAHLNEINTNKGELVTNRQMIGTIGDADGSFPAHLHLEIRKESMKDYAPTYWPSSDGKNVGWINEHYHDPSTFINSHRKIRKPSEIENLLIADKSERKMRFYKSGSLIEEYEIALSQNPIGHKYEEGDLKLPEGEYKIIQKSKGPFSGSYAEYFGSGWMRLNYPNNFDATAAYNVGRINKSQLNAIFKANKNNKEPLRNTGLGAGIGIHGWAGDWDLRGNRAITWGCISMLNDDLNILYDRVPIGTTIFITQ